MKKTILIPFILCATILFAQEKNPDLQKQQQEIVLLNQKLDNQQVVISQQKKELTNLSAKAANQEKQIENLKSETIKNTNTSDDDRIKQVSE